MSFSEVFRAEKPFYEKEFSSNPRALVAAAAFGVLMIGTLTFGQTSFGNFVAETFQQSFYSLVSTAPQMPEEKPATNPAGENADNRLSPTETGVLTLSGANTYSGNATISTGTPDLGNNTASITNSPVISIGSGATFDLSLRTSTLTLASGQGITATGTTSTGTIKFANGFGLTTAANNR